MPVELQPLAEHELDKDFPSAHFRFATEIGRENAKVDNDSVRFPVAQHAGAPRMQSRFTKMPESRRSDALWESTSPLQFTALLQPRVRVELE